MKISGSAAFPAFFTGFPRFPPGFASLKAFGIHVKLFAVDFYPIYNANRSNRRVTID